MYCISEILCDNKSNHYVYINHQLCFLQTKQHLYGLTRESLLNHAVVLHEKSLLAKRTMDCFRSYGSRWRSCIQIRSQENFISERGGDERTISIPGCVGQGDTVGKPRLFVCSGAGVWPRFARARQDPPTPSLVSPFGGC